MLTSCSSNTLASVPFLTSKPNVIRCLCYRVGGFGARPGFLGGLFGGFSRGAGAGAAEGSFNSVGTGGGSHRATYTFRKTANPQLINDIFNVCI